MIFGSRDPFEIADSTPDEYEDGQSGVFGVLKKKPFPDLTHEHNPILAGFRNAEASIASAFQAMDLAESWNLESDPVLHDPVWSPAHIDHARRVLTRLAGWQS